MCGYNFAFTLCCVIQSASHRLMSEMAASLAALSIILVLILGEARACIRCRVGQLCVADLPRNEGGTEYNERCVDSYSLACATSRCWASPSGCDLYVPENVPLHRMPSFIDCQPSLVLDCDNSAAGGGGCAPTVTPTKSAAGSAPIKSVGSTPPATTITTTTTTTTMPSTTTISTTLPTTTTPPPPPPRCPLFGERRNLPWPGVFAVCPPNGNRCESDSDCSR